MNEKPQTVMIAGQEHELGRISARKGLHAAGLIIPHIGGLKPIMEAAVAMPRGRREHAGMGIAILMDAINLMAPLLEPETFLQIASDVTNVDLEVLAEAPLEDVITATITGLARLDIMAILSAGMALFAQASQLAPPAAPVEAPAEEATT